MLMYVELKKIECKINYLLKTYVKSPQLTKKFKDALKSVPIADVVPMEDVAKEFTCVFGTPHKVSECPVNDEVAKAKADTVRKMQERLKAEAITIQDHTGKLGLVVLVNDIDQIAKEMEEAGYE